MMMRMMIMTKLCTKHIVNTVGCYSVDFNLCCSFSEHSSKFESHVELNG